MSALSASSTQCLSKLTAIYGQNFLPNKQWSDKEHSRVQQDEQHCFKQSILLRSNWFVGQLEAAE